MVAADQVFLELIVQRILMKSEHLLIEPRCKKTNNVVSEKVRHKSSCTITEIG